MNCCTDLCDYLLYSYDDTDSNTNTSERLRREVQTIEEALKRDLGTGNGASYKVKQLFNKHGFNLAIMPGHVRGKQICFLISINFEFSFI